MPYGLRVTKGRYEKFLCEIIVSLLQQSIYCLVEGMILVNEQNIDLHVEHVHVMIIEDVVYDESDRIHERHVFKKRRNTFVVSTEQGYF